MALIDFTLSNARQFYSSMGNPLGEKGLTTLKAKNYVPNILPANLWIGLPNVAFHNWLQGQWFVYFQHFICLHDVSFILSAMQFTNRDCTTGCPGVHLEEPLIVVLDLHCHLNFSFELLAFYNKNLLQLREEVHSCDWVFQFSIWEVCLLRLQYHISWLKLLSLLASLRIMVPMAAFLASLSICWTVTYSVFASTVIIYFIWWFPFPIFFFYFCCSSFQTAVTASSFSDICVLCLSSVILM